MRLSILFAGLLLFSCAAAPAHAKDSAPKYKTIEAKHFTRAEGVELTPEFVDYFYAELRTELQKTKLFTQVIGEGEVVDEADAPQSMIVDGSITEYKKGSVAKDVLIGFTAGWRSLRISANLSRRDGKSLKTIDAHVRASPRWNEKVLALEAAKEVAKQIKNSLQLQPANS
jgi:Domain of unknown function (DUF4410)